MRPILARLLRARHGNVAIMAAIIAPLMIAVLGLAIDYGSLTLQKRRLQMAADTAALVSANSGSDPVAAVKTYLQDNGFRVIVELGTTNNRVIDEGRVKRAYLNGYRDGIAVVRTGYYKADPKVAVDKRFDEKNATKNAVQVSITQKGELFFAAALATPPVLTAKGTAAGVDEATFAIGSRLTSLQAGILNALLGALLGSEVKLSVMDYNTLASAQVDLLQFARLLKTNVGLDALTYNEILDHDIKLPKLLAALGGVDTRLDPILKKLINAGAAKLSINPSRIIDLGSYGDDAAVDVTLANRGSEVKARVSELLMAALTLANEGKQIGLSLDSDVIGLIDVKLSLAIGERMVDSPAVRNGEVGSVVRTAQTRLALEVSTPGLAKLSGVSVNLPLYVELAYGQARINSIHCSMPGSRQGTVELEVQPGVGEIFVGHVDFAQLANFSKKPPVTRAQLVKVPLLLEASAYAHIAITNNKTTRLTFGPNDIQKGTIKTASTKDILATTLGTLLGDLDLKINLLGLTIGTPEFLLKTLKEIVVALVTPVDELLSALTGLLGVQLGAADVSVTSVSCGRSSLVQ